MMFLSALQSVVDGNDLTLNEMVSAMTDIMDGEVTDSQLAAFLTALHIKGETVTEIVGGARVMRAKAEKLNIKATPSGRYLWNGWRQSRYFQYLHCLCFSCGRCGG